MSKNLDEKYLKKLAYVGETLQEIKARILEIRSKRNKKHGISRKI